MFYGEQYLEKQSLISACMFKNDNGKYCEQNKNAQDLFITSAKTLWEKMTIGL